MENIKFYNVKIGTNTRAGNLNVLQSFVAQSDKDQNSIYRYYSNKYKGFGISVEEVSEIVKDEVPALSTTSADYMGRTPEQVKIQELERKLVEKNSSKFSSFVGTIRWEYNTNPEIKEKFKELSAITVQLKNKKEEIEKELKTFIANKYNAPFIEYVTIENFDSTTTYIPFRVKLNGEILSTNNEL